MHIARGRRSGKTGRLLCWPRVCLTPGFVLRRIRPGKSIAKSAAGELHVFGTSEDKVRILTAEDDVFELEEAASVLLLEQFDELVRCF